MRLDCSVTSCSQTRLISLLGDVRFGHAQARSLEIVPRDHDAWR